LQLNSFTKELILKKNFIALMFAIGSMLMQTASASTLTLTNLSAGTVTLGTGTTVAGTSDGTAASVFGVSLPFSVSTWQLDLESSLKLDFNLSGGLPFSASLFDNPNFSPPTLFDFSGPKGTAKLNAGTYYLSIFSGFGHQGVPYNLSISPSAVPVPAAVWLFGSALMGLVGVTTRKSQRTIAA
jgi:hypothetical protein